MSSPFHTYRRSFSAGEVAPILRARGDTDKIRTGGAQTLRNMQVARNGVAFNRAGTQFGGEVKFSLKATRVVSWIFDDDDRYTLEMGNGYIRFWQDNARIVHSAVTGWSPLTPYEVGDVVVYSVDTLKYYAKSPSLNKPPATSPDFWYLLTYISLPTAIYEIPSPYTDAEVFDVRMTQSFDLMWMTHPGHPPYELTRFGHADWTLLPMHFGPGVPAPTALAVSAGAGNGKDIRWQVTAFTNDPVQESLPAHETATSTAGINGGGAGQRIILLYGGAHGLSDGGVVFVTDVVDITGATAPTYLNVSQLIGGSFDVEVKDADEVWLNGTEGMVNSPGGYSAIVAQGWVGVVNKGAPSETNAYTLSWTAVPGAKEYHVYRAMVKQGTVTPSIYGFIGKSKTTEFLDTFADADADTGDVPPTYRIPFIAADGYPSAVGLFQQRLCFGGTNDHPAKFWLSRTGDLNNFSIRSPLQTDDAVTGEVAMTDVQDIRHFADGDRLIIFTGGRKCVIEGDSDGSIQPTSINVHAKGGKGGIARPPPLAIESDFLYVDAREAIVRNFRLDLVEGQKAADLTTYASHLFGGYTISDWCYQQIPQTTVWAVRSDGTLLGLTHAPEQEIDAWHRHDTGDASDFGWLSVCCIPEHGEDMLYGIVGRTITAPGTNTVAMTLIGLGGLYQAGAEGILYANGRIFDGTEDDRSSVYTLTGADGATASFLVTGFVTDQQLNGTFLTDVPTSLKSPITTLLWIGPHSAAVSTQIKQYVERMHLRKMADATYNLALDAKFLDSMLTYDGRNTTATTMELSTAPWGIDSFHTLTAIGISAPFAGNGSDVGKKYRLRKFAEYVDVEVTAFGTTLTATVKATQAVPALLQGSINATNTWSRLALTVSGLGHLESRTVGLLGDGKVLTNKVVVSGSVAVSTPSEIVHVGLPIVAQAKTLPLSAPESTVPLEALQTAARTVTALVKDTAGPRGLKVGPDPQHLALLEWAPVVQTAAQKAAVTAATISGKMRAALVGDWDNDGVLIQQTDPLPLILEAVIVTYEIGGERTG